MNTPETDKRVWSDHSEGILYEVVEASFARRLERERDEARNECDKLKQLLAADSERVDAYLGVCMDRDEAREDLEEEKRFHHRTHAELIQTQCRLMDMTQAIILTLEENRHLADGDDCTLAKLKSAVSDWK